MIHMINIADISGITPTGVPFKQVASATLSIKEILFFVFIACILIYLVVSIIQLTRHYLKRRKSFNELTAQERLQFVLQKEPDQKVCLVGDNSCEMTEWVLLYEEYHTLVVAGRIYDLNEIVNYEHKKGTYKGEWKTSSKASFYVGPDKTAIPQGMKVITTEEQDILVLHTTNKQHPSTTIELKTYSDLWQEVAALYDKAILLRDKAQQDK